MDTCKSARRLFYFLVAPGDPDLTHHMTSLACDRLHSGTPERGGRGEQAPLLPFSWGAGGARVPFIEEL